MSLEKELPTHFMDIQVNLFIHLVDDIELDDFVSTRSMFFFEGYMKTLKIYVQQNGHPKDCMVEDYVLNEEFCFLGEFYGKNVQDGPYLWDE